MKIQNIGASDDPTVAGRGLAVSCFKPITVTFQTAKQISGLGMTTLWGLTKDGRLEVVHVGRRTLIVYASLEGLLRPSGQSDPTPVKPTPGHPERALAGDRRTTGSAALPAATGRVQIPSAPRRRGRPRKIVLPPVGERAAR